MISILLARSSSNQLLRQIAVALDGQGDLRPLLDHLANQLGQRRAASAHAVVESFKDQPIVAEVRYGGRQLAANLVVPEDLDVNVVTCPHDGGRLATGGFTLVEHCRDATSESIDAIVVQCAPSMTPAEEAAVRQIPSDEIEAAVGKCLDGEFDPESLPAAVFFVTAAIWTSRIAKTRDKDGNKNVGGQGHAGVEAGQGAGAGAGAGVGEHSSDGELRYRGAAASARELLRRRRGVLTVKPEEVDKK